MDIYCQIQSHHQRERPRDHGQRTMDSCWQVTKAVTWQDGYYVLLCHLRSDNSWLKWKELEFTRHTNYCFSHWFAANPQLIDSSQGNQSDYILQSSSFCFSFQLTIIFSEFHTFPFNIFKIPDIPFPGVVSILLPSLFPWWGILLF